MSRADDCGIATKGGNPELTVAAFETELITGLATVFIGTPASGRAATTIVPALCGICCEKLNVNYALNTLNYIGKVCDDKIQCDRVLRRTEVLFGFMID